MEQYLDEKHGYLRDFQTEIRVNGKLIYVKDMNQFKNIIFKAAKEYEDYMVHHKYYSMALKKRCLSYG